MTSEVVRGRPERGAPPFKASFEAPDPSTLRALLTGGKDDAGASSRGVVDGSRSPPLQASNGPLESFSLRDRAILLHREPSDSDPYFWGRTLASIHSICSVVLFPKAILPMAVLSIQKKETPMNIRFSQLKTRRALGLVLAAATMVASGATAEAQTEAPFKPTIKTPPNSRDRNVKRINAAEKALLTHLMKRGPWTAQSATNWAAQWAKLASELIDAETDYALWCSTYYDDAEMAIITEAYQKQAAATKLTPQIGAQKKAMAEAKSTVEEMDVKLRRGDAASNIAREAHINKYNAARKKLGELQKRRADLMTAFNTIKDEAARLRLKRGLEIINECMGENGTFRIHTVKELTTTSSTVKTLLGEGLSVFEKEAERRRQAIAGQMIRSR